MYPLSRRKNIIVVGGNAAGPAAAAKAKRTDPEANVLMVEAGKFISTGTCEIPYVLSGEIKDYEEIVFFTPDAFEKEKGVKVLSSHRVGKIDRTRRIISIQNLESGHRFEQEYDKLILCTGSKAKSVPSLPSNLDNVFNLKSVSDLINLKSYIGKNNPVNILIIGAGYIGLETADALVKLGLKVSILEKEKLPFPGAEAESRNLIAELIKKSGIEYLSSDEEIKFNNDGKKFTSIKFEGRIHEYDLLITAAGVEPENSLALSAQLSLGKSGGIKTDQKMRTTDPNIFAAGDCVETVNQITGRPDYFPIATLAQQGGHIAGENAAGGNAFMNPVVKNIAVKIFGKSFVSVGLSSEEAQSNGSIAGTVNSITSNLVKVMPQSEQVFGKIIFEKRSGMILGANFLGGTETVGYGDVIAMMIRNKIKAKELANVNFNYTPPLSPFVNLLSVLGRKIEREFK